MRSWLALLGSTCIAASLGGCLIESPAGPRTRNAAPLAPQVVCRDEPPTGSHISEYKCREEPAPTEEMAASSWRNRFPFLPTGTSEHSTDTPGLRVYR
jgi:hypothetical protein